MKKNAHATLIFILGCFYFSASISWAQTIELYCKGKTSGDFQSENQEFILNVTFSPADIFDIPLRYIPGCFQFKTPTKQSCNSSKNSLNCFCSNELAATSLELSRVTGRLTIDSIYMKDSESQKTKSQKGIYSCEKVTQRKF